MRIVAMVVHLRHSSLNERKLATLTNNTQLRRLKRIYYSSQIFMSRFTHIFQNNSTGLLKARFAVSVVKKGRTRIL